MSIWDALKDLDTLILQQCGQHFGGVFSSTIRHPLSDCSLVLGLDHSQELFDRAQSSVLSFKVLDPGMGGVIVIEDNSVFVFVVRFNGEGFEVGVDELERFASSGSGQGERFVCHFALGTTRTVGKSLRYFLALTMTSGEG